MPFVDLRGHAFNDGKFAANAGLGLRYICNYVYGINAYYDYRNTHHQHYNQFAAGLEALGKIWDFRINGYLPVGRRNSNYYQTHFGEFKKHSIYLSRKKQVSLKGANAEVGYHLDHFKDFPFYFTGGLYYLHGTGRTAWGGQLKARLDIYDYLTLDGNISYDHLFRWVGQGQVSVNFPFGARRQIKKSPDRSCTNSMALSTRALQRVDRFEIIPVDTKKVLKKAIDPVTGDPYVVWFVDNTSHSQGTYESPFNTLVDAQNNSNPNDIIYVFVGDGTDNGMNGGIILKNGQQLLGAGVEQQVETTLGLINIPAHDYGLPLISNTLTPETQGGLYHAAVLLTNGDNVVSGFYCVDNVGQGLGIPGAGAGIRVNDGLNYVIKNNILSAMAKTAIAPNVPNSDALSIFGGGNVLVENNTMIARDADGCFGVSIASLVSPFQGYYVIKNNTLSGANESTGFQRSIFALISRAGAKSRLRSYWGHIFRYIGNSVHSSLSSAPMRGINVQTAPNAGSPIVVNINNNNISVPPSTATAGVFVVNQGNAPTIVGMHNNVSLTTGSVPGYRFLNTTGDPTQLILDFSNNVGTRTGP